MTLLCTLLLAAPARAAPADRFDAIVYQEIGQLRRNPARYATKLRAYRKRFEGKLVRVEGRSDLRTHEGAPAVDEAIRALQNTRPLPALVRSRALSKAAADHARDLSRTGRVSHQGSDGSQPHDRIDRHGRWEGVVGENLSFANVPAEEVVLLLLIDDGVPNRGHRKALLNPSFRLVGLASAPHRYGKVCVMTFASQIREK